MQVIEHVVQSIDSLQSIAGTYFGDASQWRTIADFNTLDYPYITTDPNFVAQVSASGTVTVTRVFTTNALTVPKGTTFAVPSTDGFPAKNYQSLQDVTISAGTATGSIPVQCTIPGLWGNIPEGEISVVVTTNNALAAAFSSVTNLQPFSNGITLNVRQIGDSLLIPVDSSWNGTSTYTDLTAFYDAQFGIDLELGDDGDLVFDGYGDVGSVAGVYNLAQAARDRLLTPNKSLVYHPEYGSLIEEWVGTGETRNRQKLLTLSIVETLLQDDRIKSVNVVSMQQKGNSLQVVIDIVPNEQGATNTTTQTNAIRFPALLENVPLAA